jgi:hypothetical protein
MTIVNDCVSSCCGAKIRVGGGRTDFIGDSRHGCTMYYECTQCRQPCNWVENEEKSKQSIKEFEKTIDETIDVFKRLKDK